MNNYRYVRKNYSGKIVGVMPSCGCTEDEEIIGEDKLLEVLNDIQADAEAKAQRYLELGNLIRRYGLPLYNAVSGEDMMGKDEFETALEKYLAERGFKLEKFG